MSDVPDRIWTDYVLGTGPQCFDEEIMDGMTEYIRADLVPRWVSVDERLPVYVPGRYLVTDGATWDVAVYNHRGWVFTRVLEAKNITHWMPLPAAPEAAHE